MDPKPTSKSLADEYFGTSDEANAEPSAEEIEEAFSDAVAMGELGLEIDPQLADEICAEIVDSVDLELLQP